MLSFLPLCRCPFHHNSKMLICWLFYLEIECGMWKSGSIHLWYLLQSGIWTVKMVHFIKGRSRVVSIVQVLDLHVRQHKFYSIVEFVQRLCYQHNNNHFVHNLQQCAILHKGNVNLYIRQAEFDTQIPEFNTQIPEFDTQILEFDTQIPEFDTWIRQESKLAPLSNI